VLAFMVLHNYISIVDSYDKVLLQKVIIPEEQGDIVDEDDETS